MGKLLPRITTISNAILHLLSMIMSKIGLSLQKKTNGAYVLLSYF